MNGEMARAAEALASVLARENAALAAMDLPGAAALLEAKRAAVEAFVVAQARQGAAGAEMARRLQGPAAENRRLLERAMAVQRRVLAVVAEAAPRVGAQAPRYGTAGALVGRAAALPVAVSASA